MSPDPLAALRDIHLPDPVSPWPPAPGWWIVGLLGVGLFIGSFVLGRRWRHRTAYRRKALHELQRLADTPDHRLIVDELAALVKRVAIAGFGHQQVARLSGEEWLRFLDRTGRTNQFTVGPGRALGEDRYRRAVTADVEALRRLVGRWIRGHRRC
ncbi:MAG: DUF4381 domain-containing protein [Thermodesulfobacteriota bacterium]